MGNVASKELCQELYEVSGWQKTSFVWVNAELNGETLKPYFDYIETVEDTASDVIDYDLPAYDLGYLLRKLPPTVEEGWFGMWKNKKGSYTAGYVSEDNEITLAEDETELFADEATPEDALCKLAIELFKQGVLTR